jgi:hypothetical protein
VGEPLPYKRYQASSEGRLDDAEFEDEQTSPGMRYLLPELLLRATADRITQVPNGARESLLLIAASRCPRNDPRHRALCVGPAEALWWPVRHKSLSSAVRLSADSTSTLGVSAEDAASHHFVERRSVAQARYVVRSPAQARRKHLAEGSSLSKASIAAIRSRFLTGATSLRCPWV